MTPLVFFRFTNGQTDPKRKATETQRASKVDERARDASRDDDASARERPRSGRSTIGGEPDASTFDGETARAERVVVFVGE